MSNAFTSGKYAIALCDRCGLQVKYRELRYEMVKGVRTNLKVCRDCWNPDHPQLKVGMYPVHDPQALREPRPDTSFNAGGEQGSRTTQWGWAPVGYKTYVDLGVNALALKCVVGSVTIN